MNGSTEHLSAIPTILHIEAEAFLAKLTGKLMSAWPEVRYLGFSMSGARGLAACRDKRPTIAVVGLGLRDIDGFSMITKLNALPCPPRILVLTGRADDYALFRIGTAKISGLVWKTPNSDEQLRAAVHSVAAGKKFFPSDLLTTIGQFRGSPQAFFKILSATEQSLLPDFGQGLSDEEIAA